MENLLIEFCSLHHVELNGQLRTQIIDGELWYMGKDICNLFGDKNHKRSLGRLDKDEKRKVTILDARGRHQLATFVNEPGLYGLLLNMQPEKTNHTGEANAYPMEVQLRIEMLHAFRRWLTHDVLPSIRKYGVYVTKATLGEMLASPEFMDELLRQLKSQRCVPSPPLKPAGRIYASLEPV